MTTLDLDDPRTPSPLLTAGQLKQVDGLIASLAREQVVWLSGYLAGLSRHETGRVVDRGASGGFGVSDERPATAGSSTRTLRILFGTETGNSRGLASALASAASAKGLDVQVSDMADYKPRSLRSEQDLLVITATHGEGDPPETAVSFFEFVEGRKAPQLPDLRFAVLALGDSTYEHFCGAGRRLDERLEELGAQRLLGRVDCDVDYDDDATAWFASALDALSPAMHGETRVDGASTSSRAAPVTAGLASPPGIVVSGVFDKHHPFVAEVLENIVLTGRGSSKETRHLEVSLDSSGLTYEPGDALGVMPCNDPQLVAMLLERLALPADAPVTVRQEPTTIGDALEHAFEITAATPRFLAHWAQITGAEELQKLSDDGARTRRIAFLRENHVTDIVDRFPAPGVDPDWFLAGLRPLQPRLYSIASSRAAVGEEAHLTVRTVRYTLRGLERTGVASGYIARSHGEDATVLVYVQGNDHFHLPADDVPIVMIGAGTGVAPYRAFMQERQERGASVRSWLFFGERNFRSDFLYQIEWQTLLHDGVLSRLDLAFSRDGAQKVYVQDRMREHGRELYRWLEEGAWLYVCGDANGMAPGVRSALLDVIAEHGALDDDGAEAYLAELKRDHRYHVDVY